MAADLATEEEVRRIIRLIATSTKIRASLRVGLNPPNLKRGTTKSMIMYTHEEPESQYP